MPRSAYGPVLAALQPLDKGELRFRADQLARVFTDRGVTFDYAGEERPFPLDLIPRVIDADEWTVIEKGVKQRVRTLEAFLADVYGPAEIFRDKHRAAVDYVPGATGVTTSGQEAWDVCQGVCQDIAHLTVGVHRAVGLPARYVSGYLHPDPAAKPGDTLEGQSHAWVEYWAGDWVAYDPTNRTPVGGCHVTVARGRDYDDVPPLKGIYHGAPSSVMDVRVEVTRLA